MHLLQASSVLKEKSPHVANFKFELFPPYAFVKDQWRWLTPNSPSM